MNADEESPDQVESEQELAERLFAERHDEAAWETAAADVKVRPSPSEVLSVRVPSDVLDQVEERARQLGESVSEFVRAAIAMRLGQPAPAAPALDRVWSSAGRLTIRHEYSESWTESAPWVPESPPSTVQGSTRSGQAAG